jgi:hypothetical protein
LYYDKNHIKRCKSQEDGSECILNESSINGLKSCADIVLEHYGELQHNCPADWVYYENIYDTNAGAKKGCIKITDTAHPAYNKSLNGPNSNQTKCDLNDINGINNCTVQSVFLNTSVDDYVNKKQASLTPTKNIIKLNENAPALVEVTMFDDTGIPQHTYLRESMKHYANALNISIDLDTSRKITEVAKKLYITKEVTKEQTTD